MREISIDNRLKNIKELKWIEGEKIMNLVAYFSHTGENYSVGVIEKGNTEIVVEYISELTKGDLFEIKPVREYSKDYKTCCEEAKKEYHNNARLELEKYLDNLEIWYNRIEYISRRLSI